MLLNIENIESIKNRNVTFVKSLLTIDDNIDFNYVSKVQDRYNLTTDFHLENINIVRHVDSHPVFFNIQECLSGILYDESIKRDSELFYSMSSGTGMIHTDREDVHLIGLYGLTAYSVYSSDNQLLDTYVLNIGDYLFVPKGVPHKSVSITPRIILSVGFYP